MNIKIPESIRKIVDGLDYKIDDIGRSKDTVINFGDKYILKISFNKESLLKEKEVNDWLLGKIPCSKNILFIEFENRFYYLRTCLDGISLIDERFLNDPILLIEVASNVYKELRSLDKYDCPFKSTDNFGNDFVHGDLCLPNIYVNKNNEFIGFIDLSNAGKGNLIYDFSWLSWSIEYNLKTDKYNNLLLDKLRLGLNYKLTEEYIPKEYRHTAFNTKILDGYNHVEEVRTLFNEYTNMIIENDKQFEEYLKLQNYEEELNNLNYKYGRPMGRLYLLYYEDNLAGCIALKKIDNKTCEMKRLYVRKQYQNLKLGRYLVDYIIRDARNIGYRYILLDTFPFLTRAIEMYKNRGFYEIESYNNNPIDNSIYLKLDLY